MPRIGVIIPCYNHARFLGEALESVLGQTRPCDEIIVVDDGSTDQPEAVAARYPGVKLIQQANQGRSAACNAGLAATTADFLVFLDADDRLLPEGIESGMACLESHADAAFVAGRCRVITVDGLPLRHFDQPFVEAKHYAQLLTRNIFVNPGAVLFRAWALRHVGGYDVTIDHCEDYSMYLKICREFPVHMHTDEVVEYRQHGANKSRHAIGMYRTNRKLLLAQKPYVSADPELRRHLRQGFRVNQRIFGRGALRQCVFSDKTWTAIKQRARYFLRLSGPHAGGPSAGRVIRSDLPTPRDSSGNGPMLHKDLTPDAAGASPRAGCAALKNIEAENDR